MKLLTKDKKDSLPYRYYYLPTLLLTLGGIVDSIYLAVSHYRNYKSLSFSSFCAISKMFNCDTVAQSPWSIFFDIPVALWGLAGYLLFFLFLFVVRKGRKDSLFFWGILFVLALVFSLTAVFLGYISSLKIKSYCILCLLSYLISFALLLYCWIVRRRFCDKSLLADIRQAFSHIWDIGFLRYALAGLFLFIVGLKTFLPHYWLYEYPESDSSLSRGVTESGHPWIGADDPVLTIEEFADYQCFQCAKMHYLLRLLMAEQPGKIRLVHRNYPLDDKFNQLVVPEPFHVGSGAMALAANAAAKQNKFWAMNDALYAKAREKKGEIDFSEIAKEIGIDADQLVKDMRGQAVMQKLLADIRQGWKHGVTGTPSFVIDGQVFQGGIPPEMLQLD